MEDDIRTGVEESAVAGQEETPFTKEDFMDTPGVDRPAATEQEAVEGEVAEQTEESTQSETVEKAFAERLKHATKKIREEVKEELIREFAQQQPQQPQQQEIPPLPEDVAERMADRYGTTPEMFRALYYQQAKLNRQQEDLRRIAQQSYERDEHSQARAYAEEVRKQNPAAPEWDDNRLQRFRENYYRDYGVVLSWRDTYRQIVADEALNPETYQKITRSAQQEAIKKITSRDRDTVQIQGQSARKRAVGDLSDEEFDRLLEEAKEGKYL